MLKPTGYNCIPWDFQEGQIVVGTKFKSHKPALTAYYEKAKLWFKSDVLDTADWAYEGQQQKVLAVLSKWCLINSKGNFEGALHHSLLNKAVGDETQVEFLFTEYVLFNGEPSLSLAEFIYSIKDKFICVDT